MGNGTQSGLPDNACGNMGDVNAVLNELQELDALIDLKAAGNTFRAGNSILDQEIAAHTLADPIQHHQREPGTVFHGAAVFIRTVVGARRNKFLQQRTVSAMDQQGVKPAESDAFGQSCIAVRQLLHLLIGHLMEMQAIIPYKVRTSIDDPLFCFLGVFALRAKVDQLIGCLRIIEMNGIGKVDKVPPTGGIFNVKVGMDRISARIVDLLAATLDLCRAALCLFQIIGDHGRFRVCGSIVLDHMSHGRSREDPVFKCHTANGNWFKNMRIVRIHR